MIYLAIAVAYLAIGGFVAGLFECEDTDEKLVCCLAWPIQALVGIACLVAWAPYKLGRWVAECFNS